MKQVIYISWMPLNEKVERDWYITHLRERGVEVAYWDVTELLLGGRSGVAGAARDFQVTVADYQHLERLVAATDRDRTNFVMIVNYEWRFNRLYRLLNSYGCRLFFFEWGNFPIKDRSGSKYLSLLRSPRKLVEKLRAAVGSRIHPVKPFDVVFAAGNASFGMHPGAGRTIAVNLCDYDNNTLVGQKPGRLVEEPYCVFLDINLAFQSDIKLVGWQYVTASEYAASLERFFSMVEQRYNVKVVVAAHPKARYGETYFGRHALQGVTAELVRDAEFVISHHSTAISYAVLNMKPLLFVYTEEMARIYRDTIVGWMEGFAEYLQQPLFRIEALATADDVEIREPDRERYDLYKYNYLTTRESEHRFTRDIFFDAVTA